MTVNYDVWGAPETWVDGTTAEQKAGIKFFADERNTYKIAWGNGFLPWNTINYPTYWGIGKGSIWAQPHFIWAWCPEGDPTQYEVDTRKVYEPHDITTIFSNNLSSGTSTYISYTRRWKYLDGEHQTSSYPIGNGTTRKIWALFDYSKIIAIPYVKCCATSNTYGSVNTYSLYEYFNSSLYNTYPEILGIGYRLRYGNGVNENRASEVNAPALLINHDFDGSSTRYDNKPYFAGIDGMSILLESANESCVIPCGLHRADQTSDATVGDSDTGFRFKYCVNTGTSIELCYFDDSNSLWKIAKKQRVSSNKTIWDYYPYIECTAANADDVRAYLITQIAFLGLPFIIDPSLATRGQIGETGVYLPKFDNKGVTTGEYAEGADALTLPNSQWTDGRESGYDPDAGEDDDGDTGDLNNFPTSSFRYGSGGNMAYWINSINLIKLNEDLNNLYLNDVSTTPLNVDFKGSNPNDYIVNLYGLPFVPELDPLGSNKSVAVGPMTLPTAKGDIIDTFSSYKIDCGYKKVPARGNFLDYEPYTQIELYIPMCGTIQLDCAQVVGRTLHLIIYYDIMTMSCVGCIYRNAPDGETLIHTINGSIGASIPLTAARMGDYQNAMQTTRNALKQNEMKTALGVGGAVIGIAGAALAPVSGGASLALAGAALGGIATAANGIMNEQQLQYELTHKQPNVAQCSTADGATAQMVSTLTPILFIKRAVPLESYDAETYGKTVGFACCINSTVGAFSGFTVYSNVDLSGIPATKTEIDMIRAKLNSGIYI